MRGRVTMVTSLLKMIYSKQYLSRINVINNGNWPSCMLTGKALLKLNIMNIMKLWYDDITMDMIIQQQIYKQWTLQNRNYS